MRIRRACSDQTGKGTARRGELQNKAARRGTGRLLSDFGGSYRRELATASPRNIPTTIPTQPAAIVDQVPAWVAAIVLACPA